MFELSDDFMQAALNNQGPRPIEEVVDWKLVVEKYLAMQGLGESKSDADDKDEAASMTIEQEKKE